MYDCAVRKHGMEILYSLNNIYLTISTRGAENCCALGLREKHILDAGCRRSFKNLFMFTMHVFQSTSRIWMKCHASQMRKIGLSDASYMPHLRFQIESNYFKPHCMQLEPYVNDPVKKFLLII
ncbi:hypothetical protein OUZ56_015104 [Daphnia magna]|uniref:Uncharacterized protein n=1 Tax=Daphnia magna TaxID=35525 RepID=A0ABR0AM23_9CRUS|nr:hypothetical protein OUZ56_015104 [Daphnia magna]